MYDVDPHVHSRFFHGFGSRPTAFDPIGLRLVRRVARSRGLDGFALTNHDYAWWGAETGHPAIPGIEVSTTRGHVLVVGPNPPEATKQLEMTPEAVVSLAHERDCAAIMPHPFRNGDLPRTDVDFDAVELNGKQLEHRPRVERLAAERDLPVVGGSDAHFPFEVGKVYTRVDAPELTPAAVVDAIQDGRVEVAVNERPLDAVLAPIYERVHRQRGHLVDAAPDDPLATRAESDH